jgi:hypothetical protein
VTPAAEREARRFAAIVHWRRPSLDQRRSGGRVSWGRALSWEAHPHREQLEKP